VYGASDEVMPFDVHFSMFCNVLENQMNEEQREKYLQLARTGRILGAYAQTELGHGSNVRGLETTATYLPEEDLIEIDSPTLTSTKVLI